MYIFHRRYLTIFFLLNFLQLQKILIYLLRFRNKSKCPPTLSSVSKLFAKAVSTAVSITVFRTKTPKPSTLWLCCISFYFKRARFCYKESSTNILICYSQLVSISKLTLTTRNQMQLAFALCALDFVLYTMHITSQEDQSFFSDYKNI